MSERKFSAEEAFDALIHRRGPVTPAWISRTHRMLTRLYPDRFVYRMAEDLDDFSEWLEKGDAERQGGDVQPVLEFSEDLDGPRVRPEGGWNVFHWNGAEYTTISFFAPGLGCDQTATWAISDSKPAATALADAVGRFVRKRRSRVMVFEDGGWDEAPRLEADLAQYSWDSVVLPETTKIRLRRAAELFFRSEHVYQELGIPWKLGLLLVGPPGTGKTLTTKILANTCGVPFLYVRGLTGSYGSRPDNSTVHGMFQGARDRAPCILCLEDVDSLVTDDLRSSFLNELDGIEEDYRGVLTVATTNHPERLDPALLHRPSRFDYRFEFPLPEEEQRRDFIRGWTEKLARLGYLESPEKGLDEIVRRSRGMTLAYLKRVLLGTVMRMHTLEERGDAAFQRLAQEELADAVEDRSAARRIETTSADALTGSRFGFHVEQ